MVDIKKPLQAVSPNPGASKPLPAEYLCSYNGRHLVQLKMNGRITIWACDTLGTIEDRVWRIENVPLERKRLEYIVALISHRDSLYPVTLVDETALINFLVGNPGKCVATKRISITEGEDAFI